MTDKYFNTESSAKQIQPKNSYSRNELWIFLKKCKELFTKETYRTIRKAVSKFLKHDYFILMNSDSEDQWLIQIKISPKRSYGTISFNFQISKKDISSRIVGSSLIREIETPADAEIDEEDRHLFRMLSENHFEPTSKVMEPKNTSHTLQDYYKNYNCSTQLQILDWGQIGLSPFFLLTNKPVISPYMVRQWWFGKRYLSLCVTPDIDETKRQIRMSAKDELFLEIEEIYPPSNSPRLLYKEVLTPTFIEKWLLDIKSFMVDRGHGDVLEQTMKKPTHEKSYIPIDNQLLSMIRNIYINWGYGRLRRMGTSTREFDFIQKHPDFLHPYLDLTIPGMSEYIILLEDTQEYVNHIIGGFYGYFPLLELYRGSDFLISRVIVPEISYGTFIYKVRLFLEEICKARAGFPLEDRRNFQLETKWKKSEWAPFDKNSIFPK